MIIDFHVHCFPDSLAKRAIPQIAERGGLAAQTDGTIAGTKAVIKAKGVDKFVMLSIATKPKQQKTINDWVISLTGDDTVIPFGSVHPLCEDKVSELGRIKKAGVKGIKLHPDYQDFYLNDPRMDDVYEECGRLGLIISFHAGIDLGLPLIVHATPTMVAEVCARHRHTTFIAAHLGGYKYWNEAVEAICSLDNLYLDTAYCSVRADHQAIKRVVAARGADMVLMASDLPWENPADSIQMIRSLGLSPTDEEKILGGNAKRLLGI